MSLEPCPECGKEVSTLAATCPHCGAPAKGAPQPPPTARQLWEQARAERRARFPETPVTPIPVRPGVGALMVVGAIVLAAAAVGVVSLVSEPFYHRGRVASTTPVGKAAPAPVLELQGWRWRSESSFVIAEGQARNIGGTPLRNVEAVVTFVTDRGELVTSEGALLEFNPVMPGQTSPFKVMATYNPAIKDARITFKTLFGGEIAWRKR